MRPWKNGFEQCSTCGGIGELGSNKYPVRCDNCGGNGQVSCDGTQMSDGEWLENIDERLQVLEEQELYAIQQQSQPNVYQTMQYIFCTPDQADELRYKLPEPLYYISKF